MKERLKIILVFVFLGLCFLMVKKGKVYADAVDDCMKNNSNDPTPCIALVTKQIKELEGAIAPLRKESTGLQAKIASAKKQISGIEYQVGELGKKLIDKEADLELQKILMSQRVRKYYIDSKKFSPLLMFFSSQSSENILQQYTWFQSIISQDKNVISSYSTEIEILNKNKKDLEVQKVKLATLKKSMEDRFGFLSGEIKKAETYKAKLNQDLINLEAQRIAALNLPKSVGSGGISCVDDRNLDPGFGSGFAFFTFGIPHHVGLNQYGALGRAKAGQSAEDIVRAYYQNIEISGGKEGETVKVNGKNEFGQSFNNESMNIEEYLKHLYEMPTSWPEAALQAQAMAARSYALRVYSEKGWLAPSQADQVVKKELNNERWISAVNATRGKVITSGGQPIKAWFASTAGGYTFTSADVWGGATAWTKRLRDTNGEINSFDDLFAKAYDRESPCFYSAQGYRSEYNKTAWLKPAEVADIVNVVLLYQKDSSIQNHLCFKDNSSGCTDTWNPDKVKLELKNRGGTPFNSISSASVTDWNKSEGRTNTLSFSGDAGQVSLNGSTFKSLFNIRAPANISIVGPLYNVEKR
ncbi:MAG: SpoIID/LytB domain-containing protein [Candidatus Shapirobacteria bacterium]|nr:SpoIID/LytB domain-containing protein [Candidatus Shapirobacteria bacterium]